MCCYLHKIISYTDGEFVGEFVEAVGGKTCIEPLVWSALGYLVIPMGLGLPYFNTVGLRKTGQAFI